MGDLILHEKELSLVRRTVAKDCNAAEFDQFIHICRAVRLDPLRKQIYAFVFGKASKRDEDRNLTIVTSIDGYRTISERSGCYRPDEDEPEIEFDETLKCGTNPLGIVKAKVKLWKFSHGSWFPVTGVAYWEEFVPTGYRDEDVEWIETGDKWESGKPKKRKVPKEGAKQVVDPTRTGWVKMPRNQIAKCAEAQAHRKGWPNDFAGLVVQEEIDRTLTIDLSATEIADRGEVKDRLERIGGPGLTIDWMDGNELQRVPVGKFYDAAMSFLRTCDGQPATVDAWRGRNRHALQEFWALDKAAALNLKKTIEGALSAPMIEAIDEPKLILPDDKAGRIESARQTVRQIEGARAS